MLKNIIRKALTYFLEALRKGKKELAKSRLMESESQHWHRITEALSEEDDRLISFSGTPAGYVEPKPQE